MKAKASPHRGVINAAPGLFSGSCVERVISVASVETRALFFFIKKRQNSSLAQMIKELYNDRERENQANVLSETMQVLDA